MKCLKHKDNDVMMVCQKQECDMFLACVECIAGAHKGHDMGTLGNVGGTVKKELNNLWIANVQYLEELNMRLERIKSMKRQIKDATRKVKASQERINQVLKSDDWIQIIQEGKHIKSVTTNEDLLKDSVLEQSPPPGTSMVAEVELTSDFQGSIYRHKSLTPESCTALTEKYSITCIAPDKKDMFFAIIDKKIKHCKTNTHNPVKSIGSGTKIRGVVIKETDILLAACTDNKCVKTITTDGKTLHSFSTAPLIPNQLCISGSGDILVTLVSSFDDPIPDTEGAVSRYTHQGKRMITFERDRVGNSICPKYVAASRVSDMVVVTTHTHSDSEGWFYGHVLVMTGDLRVKFRYLGDGRIISGDQEYYQDTSKKHFVPAIDSKDHIILGDFKSGSIEIIDKLGHKLQCLGQVDGISCLTVSIDDQLWIGKNSGAVEVFKYN
ncbi:uncharacterized protein [Argopecten irradians]|uniref:uncharacterized protein n=1 Tax=Argopecten irradians TaxID=31199 RepID=UPI003713525B